MTNIQHLHLHPRDRYQYTVWSLYFWWLWYSTIYCDIIIKICRVTALPRVTAGGQRRKPLPTTFGWHWHKEAFYSIMTKTQPEVLIYRDVVMSARGFTALFPAVLWVVSVQIRRDLRWQWGESRRDNVRCSSKHIISTFLWSEWWFLFFSL